jgi:hypothetical protein
MLQIITTYTLKFSHASGIVYRGQINELTKSASS